DYEGPITIENSTYVLWVDRDGEEIGVRGENDLKYLNHSSTPNAEFDDVKLYTLTTIKPGQEITIHYGADWDDQP
ncbi:MAG: SET domain-containing protein-lysine N-methyltransferase, partial [Methylococcales bacterium]|nr:SET domain-containing protein-lysine N-methyltransferase [Methylococcales bacterium]